MDSGIFSEIISTLTTVLTIVGGLMAVMGIVFFAIALKDQESSGYSKGILFIVSGGIIITAAQTLLPMVMNTGGAAAGYIASSVLSCLM